ncbi:hypothetical protein [Streptomyces cinnamoneus]|uniref:SnoaL-like domain-containing protein n=1 Tax=Streptomyces cinnamoneus TaxID=53446 RepID=A0A918TAB9_STRCJ|nr:hypothetical protein [Streptomyces cinnamoneus]GHC34462.1 hypothetical protein GCM10010507_04050 [Streptomyces cinnamoneus]
MRVTRTTWRSGAAVALLALLTVPAVALAAASHAPGGPAGESAGEPSAHEGDPSSATDRVAAFYGAYVDARTGTPDTVLSDALRAHFLTEEFRERLTSWELQHGVDGVFHAQNTPRAWRVTYDNSGAGHTWTRIRLTWGDVKKPTYTYLSVQSDLSTGLISDIKETGAPAGE